ncbi:hypothetical protein CVT91_03465 [Candidatus Atribacteria bacterium HGW-Atribacteria-1]|nr:MAG: hypothetical protein CVT91_03465 [Candidatus Atribacteria bacterium HGW-Atribacteria-1]
MKRKYFFVVLFLILAMFLVGCSGGGIVSPATDEAKVKSVIQDYWFALSNRQYELAKTYCILNGKYYLAVEEYQDIPYVGSLTWTFEPYFNYVEITGNNAKANINLTSTVTVCFGDICSDESETIYNWSMHLTKIGGAWKLI